MNLLWLQSGGCGGCTMSLLCSDARDVWGCCRRPAVASLASVAVGASGDEVRALLAEFESGGPAAGSCASKAPAALAPTAAGASTCWRAPAGR